MTHLTRMLWDALCGGLLSVGLMRLAFALGASPAPDAPTGRTEPAGFLPALFRFDLYVTAEQLMLLQLMTSVVLIVAAAWAIARAASLAAYAR